MNLSPVPDYPELCSEYPMIEQALQYLDQNAPRQPDLQEVASAVGLSEFHFQRLFTRWAGISPKRFLQFVTKEHAKDLLDGSNNLMETTFQVGLSSLGRLHDLFVTAEAVSPGEYQSRGAGVTIRYGLHPTPFGQCLLATTDRGICHLSFVQAGEGAAIDELVEYWQQATMVEDYRATAPLVEPIFDVSRRVGQPLPVHLKGTNFQLKVWEALIRIAPGGVTTYARIARDIGNPGAARAVGTAVGSNPIPVLIPCHRVIRSLGGLGEYRYGAARKKALLGWELSRTNMHVLDGSES